MERFFDAFEVEAFDYLLKPLDRARLGRTADRALRTLGRGGTADPEGGGRGTSVC